jgi:hypothetical protein
MEKGVHCSSFNANHFVFCELQQGSRLRIFDEGADIASAKAATMLAYVVYDYAMPEEAESKENRPGTTSRVSVEGGISVPVQEKCGVPESHHGEKKGLNTSNEEPPLTEAPSLVEFVEKERVVDKDNCHDALAARVLSTHTSKSHADVRYFDASCERAPLTSLEKRVPQKPFCVCVYQRTIQTSDVYFMDQFKVK